MSADRDRARARGDFFAGPRPLCFAHRGGAALWPENTLHAFRGALALGITHLETDVHRTRDGHLVVFHDDRLERTTDGHGFIRDLTLREVKRLDAGYRFSPDGRSFPERGKGHRVPTLTELFALDGRARLNLEMKERGVGLPRALLAAIDEADATARVLVAAAKDDVLREFRALAGGRVATGAATLEVTRFWAAARVGLTRALRVDFDALQVPVRQGPLTVVTRRFVAAAHARGVQVHVWTIDDANEMQRLVALGVDGIMSDRPDLLVASIAPDA